MPSLPHSHTILTSNRMDALYLIAVISSVGAATADGSCLVGGDG